MDSSRCNRRQFLGTAALGASATAGLAGAEPRSVAIVLDPGRPGGIRSALSLGCRRTVRRRSMPPASRRASSTVSHRPVTSTSASSRRATGRGGRRPSPRASRSAPRKRAAETSCSPPGMIPVDWSTHSSNWRTASGMLPTPPARSPSRRPLPNAPPTPSAASPGSSPATWKTSPGTTTAKCGRATSPCWPRSASIAST